MDPEVLKKLLETQEEAYKGATEILVKEFNKRIENLESKLESVIRSLEFSQAEVLELKNEAKQLKKVSEENQKRCETMQNQCHELERRSNSQEDYSRRNNIRISGMAEPPGGETWEQTAVAVVSLLGDKLQPPGVKVERAHRVGQPQPSRPRTIVACLARYSDREAALRNAKKLRGTNIFINEDLCQASQSLVKMQLPQLKQARSEGKIAYFRHTKLVIRDRPAVRQQEREPSPSRSEGGAVAGPAAGHEAAGDAWGSRGHRPGRGPSDLDAGALDRIIASGSWGAPPRDQDAITDGSSEGAEGAAKGVRDPVGTGGMLGGLSMAPGTAATGERAPATPQHQAAKGKKNTRSKNK